VAGQGDETRSARNRASEDLEEQKPMAASAGQNVARYGLPGGKPRSRGEWPLIGAPVCGQFFGASIRCPKRQCDRSKNGMWAAGAETQPTVWRE
jgi:hypothetical protein